MKTNLKYEEKKYLEKFHWKNDKCAEQRLSFSAVNLIFLCCKYFLLNVLYRNVGWSRGETRDFVGEGFLFKVVGSLERVFNKKIQSFN